jgi:membrane protein
MNFFKIAYWPLFKETFAGWSDHKALRLGASLAFYTIFAIAPLVLIALAVSGLVFGEQAAHRQLFDQLKGLLGAQGADAVQNIIASANRPRSSTWATVIALATLFVGATGTFVELQDAMNTIWQVRRKPGGTLRHFITDRLLSFAMMLAIGFLLLVSLIISAALAALSHFMNGFISSGTMAGEIMNFLISFAVIGVLFAMIFKFLPDVKIPWRNTWMGAALSALLFNIGKFVLGFYLGHSSVSSTYGAAGSLIALLMWVYYSSQTLFLGAEFSRAYSLKHGEEVRVDKDAEFIAVKELKNGERLAPSAKE